jgi:hypothetical protein
MNTEINKALHTMTAHLHRYGSELGWLQDIVSDISAHHASYHEDRTAHREVVKISAGGRVSLGLRQVGSQLKAVTSFRQELENKTRNILALVSLPTRTMIEFRIDGLKLFNNIQVSNDKMVVANGAAMAKMLRAARTEAKMSRRIADQSQQIALEMQEDSVAMKTV